MAEATGLGFPDKQHCELAYGVGKCVQGEYGAWYLNALVPAKEPTPAAPGIDWDPLSWGKSALSDIFGGAGSIEKWVIKQIVKAASLIENDIAKVYGYVASRFGGIENTISHLAGQVNTLAGKAGRSLEGDVGKLGKDAEGWVKDAENYADSALRVFERDVLDPALRKLHAAVSDAEKASKAALSAFERDVVKPIEHDAAEALHDAKKAVSFIDHSALDAIHIVDECWEWLEWMAKNPAKALEELPAKMLGQLTAAELEQKGATVTSGWSGLLADLERKFPDKAETEL